MKIILPSLLLIYPFLLEGIDRKGPAGFAYNIHGCWHKGKSEQAARKIDIKAGEFQVFLPSAKVHEIMIDLNPKVSEGQCDFLAMYQANVLSATRWKFLEPTGGESDLDFIAIDENTFELSDPKTKKKEYFFRYKAKLKDLAQR